MAPPPQAIGGGQATVARAQNGLCARVGGQCSRGRGAIVGRLSCGVLRRPCWLGVPESKLLRTTPGALLLSPKCQRLHYC